MRTRTPDATSLCTGDMPGGFYFSAGVDVTPDGGSIWVADYGNNRVLRFRNGSKTADLVLGQATMLTGLGQCSANRALTAMCRPNGVRYDPARDRLYVLDGDNAGADPRILVFDHPTTNGPRATAAWGPPAGSNFFWPRGLTLDAAGNVWINDTDNSRVLQYDPNGHPIRVLSKGDFHQTGCIGGLVGDNPKFYPQVCHPHGSVGIDRDGSVYVADLQEHHIERFPGPIPLPRADGVAHSADAYILGGDGWGNHIGPTGLANPAYVTFVDDQQLVVADRRRILFWNDYLHQYTAAASGVLAQPNFCSTEVAPSTPATVICGRRH